MTGSTDEPREECRTDLVSGETFWVPLNGQRPLVDALQDLDDAVFRDTNRAQRAGHRANGLMMDRVHLDARRAAELGEN